MTVSAWAASHDMCSAAMPRLSAISRRANACVSGVADKACEKFLSSSKISAARKNLAARALCPGSSILAADLRSAMPSSSAGQDESGILPPTPCRDCRRVNACTSQSRVAISSRWERGLKSRGHHQRLGAAKPLGREQLLDRARRARVSSHRRYVITALRRGIA